VSVALPTTPSNPWIAHSAEIVDVVRDYAGVSTYHLRLTDATARSAYSCQPGQFNMLYLPGVGEAAISVSGHDGLNDTWLHTVRTAGNVTRALERLGPGGKLALRGPFGTAWPLEQLAGRDLIFAAGGIGLAPLRMAIQWSIRERSSLGRVTLLYGARSPATVLYPAELAEWQQLGIDVQTTVDRCDSGWTGRVGVVPLLVDRLRPFRPEQTSLLMCGPDVMMRYTAQRTLARGMSPTDVWLSLERNMQCAVGFCGHCQLGPAFICKDGPVFRYDRMSPYLATEDL
jgi:NAD(P)H-flavin reductase